MPVTGNNEVAIGPTWSLLGGEGTARTILRYLVSIDHLHLDRLVCKPASTSRACTQLWNVININSRGPELQEPLRGFSSTVACGTRVLAGPACEVASATRPAPAARAMHA